MRILHTSDWHIGRQFHNVSLLEDQAYVLEQILEIAEAEQVDVVLIAGDIYDRAIPPAAAVSLVDKILNHLCNELNIPVIMIAGNHDGPERLGFGSRQLMQGNLHISGPLKADIKPVLLEDEFGEVLFYPIPYADPATVRDIYPDEDAENLRSHDQCMAHIIRQIAHKNSEHPEHYKHRSVALSHCFLAGGGACESERPLSVGGADQVSYKHFKNFNYTALGHLHRQQHQGAETVRYSGSILKYSFSEEQHKKSVTLLNMDAKGQCDIRHVSLNARRDMRSITGALDDIIADVKNNANSEDYLLISLTDTHAILDPMGKLRAIYPNVLHLERPGLMSIKKHKLAHHDLLKKSELSMFKDFFKQVQDEDISEQQEMVLVALLDKIHHEEDDKKEQD